MMRRALHAKSSSLDVALSQNADDGRRMAQNIPKKTRQASTDQPDMGEGQLITTRWTVLYGVKLLSTMSTGTGETKYK